MNVLDMMYKLSSNPDSADIDFCDDYDERALCAYCGTRLTEAGKKQYERALNLKIDENNTRLSGNYPIVIVHCDKAADAQALADLLYGMAGYIEESEFNEYFLDSYDLDEKETVRHSLEVVLSNGSVLKATSVELDMLYRPSAEEFKNPDCAMRNGRSVPGFAVHTTDGECVPVYYEDVVRIIGEVQTNE